MQRIFLLTLAIVCVAACSPKSATITISANGMEDSTFYVSRPIENFPLGVTDTIVVGNGRSTTIEVPIEQLSAMWITNQTKWLHLIIEPGEEYTVTFDISKTPIASINDTVQMVLNTMFDNRNFYKYEFPKDYSSAPLDTIGSKMYANFENLITQDRAVFENMKMSDAKRKFIDSHIELFWIGSMAKVIRSDYYNLIRSGKEMNESFAELGKRLYEDHPLTEYMTPSHLLGANAELMVMMNNLKSGIVTMPKTEQEYWQQKYDKLYGIIENNKVREAAIALTLYWDAINNTTNSKELVTQIDRFNAEYPNNRCQAQFKLFSDKIVDFHKKIAGDFTPGIKFVKGGDSIETFKELIGKFRGKPIFIDFWFSTCSPCREQFAYGEPLKKFLSENGIELLYISVDKKEEHWHNSIKYFNLEGNHIKANQALHTDLAERYEVIYYPRFMVINSAGEVVVSQAKQPSEGQELYDQIKEALQL